MTALFLAATGTDIGKTFIAEGLIRELRRRGRAVAAVKPVVSGFEEWSAPASDPARLLAALGLPASAEEIARISPWRFRAALSPDEAARREGKSIDFAALCDLCKREISDSKFLLVEGIGGIMVPLDERHTTLDWTAALACPAVLVAGNYLGTISHTLTALTALAHRRVPVAAVVVSDGGDSAVPLESNVAAIARFARGTPVLALPRIEPGATHPTFGALADLAI